MSNDSQTTEGAAAPSTTPASTAASNVEASSETSTAETSTPETSVPDAPDHSRSARKVREGNVISDKMAKTVVVAVIERIRHPKYGKFMMRTKKLYAHDEGNDAHVGDKVRVMETRPMSKNKRWRVVEVLERAK